ncbi:MAG: zinc-dependent peptidase, partial [Polyangiaceae bacterium]
MRAAKRKRLRETPLEPDRVAIIAQRFAYFARLSAEDQRELLGHVQVFLDEKNFEGCGGLELTDEIKLTIAAQACLLLLHRDTDYYPGLDAILVYPSAYRARKQASVGRGVVIESDQVRLGESHQRGIVVLSWDAILRGGQDEKDAHNVVLHEFAHQLDQEDGDADGAPVLENRADYKSWAHVFLAEYETLVREAETGARTDIDSYGATNPAEFFAVVTEAFFEQPEKLAKNHPRLYEQLSRYYKQDPLARLGIAFEPPPPEAPSQPPPEPEKTSAPRSDTTLSILRVEGAAKLVGVSESFRESVLALGCKPQGWLSTIHATPGERSWGFVAEVFSCPDASVVAAIFSISGDGAAFWTLLDNGTILSTETMPKNTRWVRFFFWPTPRKLTQHLFLASSAEPPAALYAWHLDRVREIAKREGTAPVSCEPLTTYRERDAAARTPLTTYAACRLRSTDLLDGFFADFKRRTPLAHVIVLVAATAAMISRATVIDRGTVGVSLGVGVMAAL